MPPVSEVPASPRSAARLTYVVLLWLAGARDGFLGRPPVPPEFQRRQLIAAARRMRGEVG